VQLLPGVAQLVAHLTAHGVPIAIATGSVRRDFERKTAHLQHVFAHFGSNVVCADDGAGRGKPFPDVFLAAARLLGRGVGPNEEGDVVAEAEREERVRGLVFEDSIPGVQAARRAGMNGGVLLAFFSVLPSNPISVLGAVVWVPDENILSVGPSQGIEKPDQVLRSLEAFIPEEWGLPPFGNVPASQQTETEN